MLRCVTEAWGLLHLIHFYFDSESSIQQYISLFKSGLIGYYHCSCDAEHVKITKACNFMSKTKYGSKIQPRTMFLMNILQTKLCCKRSDRTPSGVAWKMRYTLTLNAWMEDSETNLDSNLLPAQRNITNLSLILHRRTGRYPQDGGVNNICFPAMLLLVA